MLLKYGKVLTLLSGISLIGTGAFAARTYEKVCGSYEKVCENGKCGIAQAGQQGPLKYDAIGCLHPGIIVSTNGKWGIYDEQTNRELGAVKYDAIENMDVSHAKVKLGQTWGMVHKYTGKEILPPQYQEIEFLDTVREYVKAKDKSGWHIFALNQDTFRQLSAGAYESVEPLKNYYKGYYQVKAKGKMGVVQLESSEEGTKLTEFVPPEFDDVAMPPSYTAVKVSNSGKWAFYSLNDKKVTTPFYDTIEKQFNLYQVGLKGKVGLVSWNKQKQQMEEVVPPSYEKTKVVVGGKLIGVLHDGKWGVYDVTVKKLVLPCRYDDVKSGLKNKEVKVKQGEEWVSQKLEE